MRRPLAAGEATPGDDANVPVRRMLQGCARDAVLVAAVRGLRDAFPIDHGEVSMRLLCSLYVCAHAPHPRAPPAAPAAPRSRQRERDARADMRRGGLGSAKEAPHVRIVGTPDLRRAGRIVRVCRVSEYVGPPLGR